MAAPLPIYVETFRVRHSEADVHGRLKLRALADYIQKAAAVDAERLGFGRSELLRCDRIWVLSRLRLELSRYPQIGDAVTIRTWPSTFDKLFARRQFELRMPDGEPAARGSSWWLLAGAGARRPLRPELFADRFPDHRDLPEFFPALDKIPRRRVAADRELTVEYSDVDVNGHLNNAEYAAIVQNFLGDRFQVGVMQLNFIAEAKPGATFRFGGAVSGADFYVEGVSDAGLLHFQAAGRAVATGS